MIMIPPCMLPIRRKSKAEKAADKHRELATTIMTALKRFQPKRKKK